LSEISIQVVAYTDGDIIGRIMSYYLRQITENNTYNLSTGKANKLDEIIRVIGLVVKEKYSYEK
jgi:hypothetical protein